MGRAELLAAIESAARTEARATVAAALREARAMLAAARREADRRVAEAVAAAEPTLRGAAARRVNEVRMQELHERASGAADRLARVFSEAETDLLALADGDSARWRAALERWRDEAHAIVGDGRVAAAPSGGHGLAVRSHDGRVEVEATLETRLAGARAHLAGAVAGLLDGEER